MAKRLQEYVKYTTKELDLYTKTEGSCVQKVNANLHLSIGPYALADFKKALLQHLAQTKIGFYNLQLEGIVLDIKNIKVLGKSGALRFDDPKIHVDINADCYIFRPIAGAVLSGIVKHISTKHVGVIIYRVFNATIKFFDTLVDDDVEIDKEVQFRIIDYNILNVFPYIEGELLSKKKLKREKGIKIESGVDSGIEEKESTNELDDFINLIKEEPATENQEIQSEKKKKPTKRKHSLSVNDDFSLGELGASKKNSSKKAKKSHKVDISIKEEVD